MAKKKSSVMITSEMVDAAVTSFLEKGGEIKKIENIKKDERHIDWITSDYLNKIRDEKKITIDDAKLDTSDYSSSEDWKCYGVIYWLVVLLTYCFWWFTFIIDLEVDMLQSLFVFCLGALFGFYFPEHVVKGIEISQDILTKFLSWSVSHRGGIGRRTGLKIRCPKGRGSSNLPDGTKKYKYFLCWS